MPDKGRYAGSSEWGLGVGLTFSPRKNSTVSKPWQRRGRGTKTGRSATEEEEEEEEEEVELEEELEEEEEEEL